MTEKLTVSVLGTGIMGAAMARNLVRAGHTVHAWNRSPAKAEPLAADGAQIAATPAEAVRDADVVLTMLYDGPAVLEVMREAVPGLRPGIVWVQSTTAGIEAVGELAGFAREHGLVFFDAPVLGTREAGRGRAAHDPGGGPGAGPGGGDAGLRRRRRAHPVDGRGRRGGRRHPPQAGRQQLGPGRHQRGR